MVARDYFAGAGDVQSTTADNGQTGSREALMRDLRTSDGRTIRGVRGDGNQDISLDNGQIVIHNRGKIEIYRENNGGVDYRNEGQSQYDLRQHIPYARQQGQETRNRFASGNDDYGLDSADQEVAAYHAAQNQARINQRQFSPMTYPQSYGMPAQPGAYYGPQENGVAQTVDAFGRLLGAVAPIGLAALALHGRGGGVFIGGGGYGGWGGPQYGGYQPGWGGYQTGWNSGNPNYAWNANYAPNQNYAWSTNPNYALNSNPNYAWSTNPNYALNSNPNYAWNGQQQQTFFPYPTQFRPPNPGYIANPTAYNYQLASGWGNPQYAAQPYYNVG